MKVTRHKGNQERGLLTAMIVNKVVLASIVPHWTKDGLFKSRWANIVGRWCVRYFTKYKKVPGKQIQRMYDEWADTKEGKDKENVDLVGKFIEGLSNEYVTAKKDVNPEFMLDVAQSYFRRVQLKGLAEQVEGELDGGDVDKAETLINTYRKIEIGRGSGINVLTEESAMLAAFEERGEPLIRFDGALQNFFGNAFERDSFVCYMGKEKVGKTWWLIETAWTAMSQQRRTAFFEVGDMSQNQLMRRFMVKAAKHPWAPCTLKVPISLEPGTPPTATHETKNYPNFMSHNKAAKSFSRIHEKLGGGDSYLRMFVHPNNSLTASGIGGKCEELIRDGWVPDVIVIDYADLLAPMNGTADTRDQINMTWKTLRSLSQQYHCCVVAATQADAASYTTDTLKMSNFSEDKRKLAHCTGMVGINQGDTEKQNGITRLNWVVLREGEFSEEKCVYACGCLGIGRPAMFSVF